MKKWKQAPLDQVIAQYVECYWLLEYEQGENNAVPPILPPGNQYSDNVELCSHQSHACELIWSKSSNGKELIVSP
ncbi:hypothetical protein [Photobacterium marinum]|uniref:hypothetical protein n=1 Tax=Photobacterium marinum TaxID=1056511 RepID=UPI0012F8950B|nr:hypothetical protein [Photobacterium marinum]